MALNTTMEADSLTREMVRGIRKNKPLMVKLPDYAAIMAARQTVTQVSALSGKKYSANVDRQNNTILITLL